MRWDVGWQNAKYVLLLAITPIVLLLAIVISLPKSLYGHWRDK
jgi:hypothetical protein